jgi:hypothetical protein
MKIARPPLLAEALLREFLSVRDRDTVTGDLLEEYREAALPERGVFRARLWYLRQVLSLLTWSRLGCFANRVLERNSMTTKNLVTSLVWTAAALSALCAVFIVLVRNRFEPPPPSILLFLTPIVLGICAATALRSASTLHLLWRAGRIWAVAFAAVFAMRIAVDTIAPFDVEQYFLAQSRSDFSEFDFPRRFLVGVAIALILMAAGFQGAWKTGRIRPGMLVAMAASLMVSLPAAGALVIFSRSAAPTALVLVALGVSAVLGSIGAMLGRGVGGMLPRRAGVVASS